MDVKEAIERYEYIKNLGAIFGNVDKDFFLDFAETILSELEKKDEIINLMAKYIAGLDIDEDICKNIDCDNNTNAETGEIDCNNCVIDYFTKKVGGK